MTLDETVHIPAFSEKEVPARIDKSLRDGVWILEGDRSGRLLVSVANALVNVTSHYVPVRMINTQCESVIIFKGTKVGIVEETAPPTPVAAVEPGVSKDTPYRSRSERCLDR